MCRRDACTTIYPFLPIFSFDAEGDDGKSGKE